MIPWTCTGKLNGGRISTERVWAPLESFLQETCGPGKGAEVGEEGLWGRTPHKAEQSPLLLCPRHSVPSGLAGFSHPHTHLLHPGPPESQVPDPIERGGQEETSRPSGPPLRGVTGPRFTARRWLGWDDENILCRELHASPAAVPARRNLGVSLCRV